MDSHGAAHHHHHHHHQSWAMPEEEQHIRTLDTRLSTRARPLTDSPLPAAAASRAQQQQQNATAARAHGSRAKLAHTALRRALRLDRGEGIGTSCDEVRKWHGQRPARTGERRPTDGPLQSHGLLISDSHRLQLRRQRNATERALVLAEQINPVIGRLADPWGNPIVIEMKWHPTKTSFPTVVVLCVSS